MQVDRLYVAGDRLVAIGQNREIAVMDARFGDDLRTPAASLPTPDRVTVAGDTLVIAAGRTVLGLSVESLEHRWDRSCTSAVADWFVLPERGWLVYRELASDQWTAIDAASGRLELTAEIAGLGKVTAAASVGEQLLVAGVVDDASERRGARAKLVAVNIESGRVAWRRDFVNVPPLNLTQLAAHPQFIPILTVGGSLSAPAFMPGRNEESPDLGIELLDRHSGAPVGERVEISKGFAGVRDVSRAYMLATSSRIIVAAGGRLLAYGTPGLGVGHGK